jgi:hypothetical protein
MNGSLEIAAIQSQAQIVAGTGGAAPAVDEVLIENGDKRLLENGDSLLLG